MESKIMRQPKYKMGDQVKVSLSFKNVELGINENIIRQGTVCGVWYDPRAENGPWYYYYVQIPHASKKHVIIEHDLDNHN